MSNQHLVVFTDLDGTLLDLHSYSHKGAESALSLIRERNIPLIFCSSKTRTEQEYYQRELKIHHPFIVENGGAIFIRKDYFDFEYEYRLSNAHYNIIEIGMPYQKIRKKLLRIRKEFRYEFKGYGDMPVRDVSALTGLNLQAAKRAMARDYSETINFTDSAEQLSEFKMALDTEDLQCAHGGRFLTVTGKSNNKGKAVRILTELFFNALGPVKTFGLGDAMNDLPLFAEVDYPILLQRPEVDWQPATVVNLRRISGSGPEVWGRVITEILQSEKHVRKLSNVK